MDEAAGGPNGRFGGPVRTLALSLVLILVCAGIVRAAAGMDELLRGTMDDAALVVAFAGRNLEGVYANAVPWSESYGADGSLSYRDRKGVWPGDWTVRNARFCTFYRTGDLNGGCFLVARRGDNCFDFYAVGAAFEPGVSSDDIAGGRNWTARGWYVEAEPSCPEDERQIVELILPVGKRALRTQ